VGPALLDAGAAPSLNSASRDDFRQSQESAWQIDHYMRDVVEPFDAVRKPTVIRCHRTLGMCVERHR
jgi:hypothetical protein